MTTSSNAFDRIFEEIMHQKQALDELVAENYELRQQLGDLRSGQGIFIDIQGTRFALRQQPASAIEEERPAAVSQAEALSSAMNIPQSNPDEADAAPMVVPTTPPLDAEKGSEETTKQVEKKPVPSFLEEIMLDEFTKIATSPMVAWKTAERPKSTTKIEAIHVEVAEEEEKAEIRKALTGSYLLE